VYIQTSRFDNTERYSPYIVVQMHEHTDDLLLITKAAMKGIDQIFKKGFKYKKAGIVLLEITDQSKFVPDLFTDYSHKQERERLSDAIEAISERFGKNLVTLGIANNKEATWHMNQNLRSPSYLTKWSDLPRVG
jgi:DNA polymerase V